MRRHWGHNAQGVPYSPVISEDECQSMCPINIDERHGLHLYQDFTFKPEWVDGPVPQREEAMKRRARRWGVSVSLLKRLSESEEITIV